MIMFKYPRDLEVGADAVVVDDGMGGRKVYDVTAVYQLGDKIAVECRGLKQILQCDPGIKLVTRSVVSER